MDDGELMNVNFMDLDLNQEPVEPSLHRVSRYGSLLNDLETAHERIEERIRQLEAVNARARQRQRWRQVRNSIETSYIMADESSRGVERGKGYKRDSSHLVARALEMNSEVKKVDKDGGSFYDCNICLDEAREPILTCCGHLFCWPCFYQVSYIDATARECPVCKGEVSDSTVIPIFGNGDGNPVRETGSGLIIPPRPKARRIEGVKQRRATHVPVVESPRQIRISIGAMEGQTQQLESTGGSLNFEGQNSEGRSHQVSRVLSESAASLTSLSSALTNAERLAEDSEAAINSGVARNDGTGALPVISNGNQPPDATEYSSTRSTSRVRRSFISMISGLNSQDSHEAPSSSPSLGRRSLRSRISDLDSRNARRRRLN